MVDLCAAVGIAILFGIRIPGFDDIPSFSAPWELNSPNGAILY